MIRRALLEWSFSPLFSQRIYPPIFVLDKAHKKYMVKQNYSDSLSKKEHIMEKISRSAYKDAAVGALRHIVANKKVTREYGNIYRARGRGVYGYNVSDMIVQYNEKLKRFRVSEISIILNCRNHGSDCDLAKETMLEAIAEVCPTCGIKTVNDYIGPDARRTAHLR